MKSTSRTVADLIDALGGVAVYARIIEQEYSTASEHKRSGRIPVKYWPSIIDEARKVGARLAWVTSDALMKMHAEQGAARAGAR